LRCPPYQAWMLALRIYSNCDGGENMPCALSFLAEVLTSARAFPEKRSAKAFVGFACVIIWFSRSGANAPCYSVATMRVFSVFILFFLYQSACALRALFSNRKINSLKALKENKAPRRV